MTVSASIRNALVIGITFLLGLGLATWWHRQAAPSVTDPTLTSVPITDEERPPIIVSGGSVNLWETYPANYPSKGRGDWTSVAGTSQWQLKYSKPGWKAVTYLEINLNNVEFKNNTTCDEPSLLYKVAAFKVDLGGNSYLTVGFANGNVEALFSGSNTTGEKGSGKLGFWLTTDKDHSKKLKMKGIEFEDLGDGNKKKDCQFVNDSAPIIMVHQRWASLQ